MKKIVYGILIFGFLMGFWVVVDRVTNPITKPEARAENPRIVRSVQDAPDHKKAVLAIARAGESRSGDLAQVIGKWAATEPEEALSWIENELEGSERVRALDAGLRAYALKNPEGAAAWVEGGKGDPLQERWAAIVGAIWAGDSPEDAAVWAIGIENPDVREGAAIAVTSAWATEDPAASAEWAIEFYEETESPAPLQTAIGELAEHDLLEAREFVDQIPDELDYVGVVQVGMEWAESDPLAAAAWAAGLNSATNRAGALTGIVGVWAEDAPGEAADFVDGLSGAAQSSATRLLVKEWVESDAVAASEWLQTVSEGEARDEGISALSDGLMDSDPASAMQWSLAIEDEIMREFQVEDVLHSWFVRDQRAVESWLTENQVPADVIERAKESAALN
ncbi:MAG: hypothetical protein AAGA58_14370 [Verrucomicrobiota bacterium]